MVELRLVVGALVLPLAQLGPSFAILKEITILEPTAARIEVIVDNRVSTVHNVFLPHGVTSIRFEYL